MIVLSCKSCKKVLCIKDEHIFLFTSTDYSTQYTVPNQFHIILSTFTSLIDFRFQVHRIISLSRSLDCTPEPLDSRIENLFTFNLRIIKLKFTLWF